MKGTKQGVKQITTTIFGFLFVLGLAAGALADSYTLSIELDPLYNQTPGTTYTIPVTLPMTNMSCGVTVSDNNESVHDNDLQLISDIDDIWFYDVEREPNAVTVGDGVLEVGGDPAALLVIHFNDYTFSLDPYLEFECEPPPTSTTTSTTVTTVPPSSTTTIPPSTTEPPPTTTTTTSTTLVPPPSSTTAPPPPTPPPNLPTIGFDCENRDSATGVREPVIVVWPEGPVDGEVTIAVIDDTGKTRALELYQDPTPGYHDVWFGPGIQIDGRTWVVQLFIDDVLIEEQTKIVVCPPPPTSTVVTDPPPETQPPSTQPPTTPPTPTGIPTGNAGLVDGGYTAFQLSAIVALLVIAGIALAAYAWRVRGSDGS